VRGSGRHTPGLCHEKPVTIRRRRNGEVPRALPVFERFRKLVVFQELASELGEENLHLRRSRPEELAPEVDSIEAPVGEASVELRLDTDRVLREEQCMDVELEWNRGIAEFADAVTRFQRRVMPILTTWSPNDPMFEITYT
jgi:hypothetical protein